MGTRTVPDTKELNALCVACVVKVFDDCSVVAVLYWLCSLHNHGVWSVVWERVRRGFGSVRQVRRGELLRVTCLGVCVLCVATGWTRVGLGRPKSLPNLT